MRFAHYARRCVLRYLRNTGCRLQSEYLSPVRLHDAPDGQFLSDLWI